MYFYEISPGLSALKMFKLLYLLFILWIFITLQVRKMKKHVDDDVKELFDQANIEVKSSKAKRKEWREDRKAKNPIRFVIDLLISFCDYRYFAI